MLLGRTDRHAFIWDPIHGMRDLERVLRDEYGLTNLHPWGLQTAWAISADRRTIVGSAARIDSLAEIYEYETWLVHLDTPIGPPLLPGDFNFDGMVDAADYVVWRNGLGTTHNQADYNAWRANFGRTATSTLGSALGSNPAVPEPAGAVLLVIATTALLVAPRHRLRDPSPCSGIVPILVIVRIVPEVSAAHRGTRQICSLVDWMPDDKHRHMRARGKWHRYLQSTIRGYFQFVAPCCF
jgi:hypothetical protein